MVSEQERQQVIQLAHDKRGYWSPGWDAILETSPEFMRAYIEFSSATTQGGALDPKVRELILIAVDASVTHLYEPGLRVHIRQAREAGATTEEIAEVLQLVSVLGIHSCTVGMRVLREELGGQAGESHDEGG